MGVELKLLAWRDEHTELLRKYDTRVREIVTQDFEASLLEETRKFVDAREGRYQEEMFAAFGAGDYARARDVTHLAVEVMERHLERHIGLNGYRRDLGAWSNAVNREGFLTLLMDEPGQAKRLFDRALSIDSDETALRLFNLGRSHMALGEWSEAVTSFELAGSRWRQGDLWFLVAAIDLPDGVRSPSALLAEVDPEWGPSFCEVHNVVAQIRSGSRELCALDQAVQEQFADASVPLVVSRIQAWEHFRAGAGRKALEVLLRADQSHHGDAQLETEILFLEREV